MADYIIDFVNNFQGLIKSAVKMPTKAPEAPPAWELLYKGPIYVLVAWIGASIFEGIFNIFNHELADFPGPKLAAFIPWYKTYCEVVRGESWVDVLERLHAKYGKIVRVGPNELDFSDPAAYHEIYNNSNRWDKEASLYRRFGPDHSSFGFLKCAENQKRKDILNPLFSHRAISDLQNLVQGNVDRLCEALTANNAAGRSSDLFLGLRCFTLDTVTAFCFAKSVDALGEPEFKAPVVEAMERSLPVSVVFKHFPLIRKALYTFPFLGALAGPRLAGLAPLQKLLRLQIKEVTSNPHSMLEAPHKTIYSELLRPEANVNGKAPTNKSLYDEARALVFGGTDTIANALMIGIFNMLEQPELVERLRQELLEVWPVPENAPPKFEELEKLPFLTAVIKESLRTSPGVTSPLSRIVPKGGATIGGSLIPVETTVGMTANFVHNSETIFKNPKDFDPDRWLEADASLDKWLVAFSKGPRMCLGQNLAYCELYLAFASLFRRFDLKLDSTSGHVSDSKWRDCFLPYFEGPHLKVVCQPAVK